MTYNQKEGEWRKISYIRAFSGVLYKHLSFAQHVIFSGETQYGKMKQ